MKSTMKFLSKKILFICGLSWSTMLLSQSSTVTQYVNPFIGTGAVNGSSLSGNNFPGATTPFGMVQLSPDTKEAPDWSVASGYNYNDKSIYGFSHTHLSGTGVGDLFDISLMPYSRQRKYPIYSRFDHEEENAKPGYYQVNLLEDQIKVELTATQHAGFQKYTYHKDSAEFVLLDLDHSMPKGSWGCRIIAAQIRIIDKHTIEGFRIITGWVPLRKIYFYAKFSKPIIRQKLQNGSTLYKNQSIINGTDLKAYLKFEKNSNPLLVKLALSPVSTENAKANLEAEIPNWDINNTTEQANNLWQKELGKIQIEGTEKQKRIFYTAMYHAFTQPNKLSDVNGDYMAADYTTRNEPNGYYSTFSLWDMYRAAAPLYTILQPKKTSAFVNSMIDHYEEFGLLPIWGLWGQENYCMIGNHAIPVVVNAVLNHLPGINPKAAYEAVKNSSLTSHINAPFDIWEKYHYMPENLQSQSVSITLEMSYDDWCVAQLAQRLGKTEDYKHFMDRSKYYKNLYDANSGFFRAKNDKKAWIEPFSPLNYGANGGNPYTEGNAWQYLWYVPQDIPSLISLIGGKSMFIKRLDSLFTLKDSTVKLNDNASGLIGQYAHGNEPSHHIAYLYDYAGVPWKTQFYTHKILQEMYNDSFSGYAGNEDCGQMASWYIFSAMGFYPVNPANGIFAIGSPLLQQATINLPSGKTFTVNAKNVSNENIYIQSATLNGRPFTHTYLTIHNIQNGGKLVFIMGDKPNKKWGTNKEDIPPYSIFNKN